MKLSLGVAITRRAADLVVVQRSQGRARILLDRHLDRPPEMPPPISLARVMEDLPAEFRRLPVRLALTSGICASTDQWELPAGIKVSALSRMAAPHCEARSAGESLEELSVDAVLAGRVVRTVAVRSDLVRELKAASQSCNRRLDLVTAVPLALAQAFSSSVPFELVYAGERVTVHESEGGVEWRSFPVEHPPGDSPPDGMLWKDERIPVRLAAAFAAAVADLDSLPDALRGDEGRARGVLRRQVKPVAAVLLGLFLLLFALGARCEDARRRSEVALVAAQAMEAGLWKRHFPGVPRRVPLLDALRVRARELGEDPATESIPSALSLWIELGKHLPNVESLGMTLESLDLTPEGGRLVGIVPTAPQDSLKNATLLEEAIGGSEKIVARGDFEARDGNVYVRLRLDRRSGGAK